MENCPWSQFAPNQSLFQVCEESLCAWIAQPSNTWSNIGYLMVALWIFNRTRGNRHFLERVFIFMSVGIFVGSTAFHMSSTRVGQIMDLGAIFLLSGALFTFSMKRFFNLNRDKSFWLYLFISFTPIAYLVLSDTPGLPLLALIFASSLIIEMRLWNKRITKDPKYLLVSLVVFLVAFSVWLLDNQKILCDPDNHIFSGHSLWHLLSAVAIYYQYRFFRNEI